MSTDLPEESSVSFARPSHSFKLSYPPSSVRYTIEDRVGRLSDCQIRSTLRNHPYIRLRLPRLQNDSSNMAIQSLSRNELNRRRRRRLAASSTISAHLATTVSMAHPSALQQTRKDTRGSQHDRLVRLFEIPEFFRVVREGWGAAFRAEKCASTSITASAGNEEGNAPGYDNESVADHK